VLHPNPKKLKALWLDRSNDPTPPRLALDNSIDVDVTARSWCNDQIAIDVCWLIVIQNICLRESDQPAY